VDVPVTIVARSYDQDPSGPLGEPFAEGAGKETCPVVRAGVTSKAEIDDHWLSAFGRAVKDEVDSGEDVRVFEVEAVIAGGPDGDDRRVGSHTVRA
jgi:hypothetical protein